MEGGSRERGADRKRWLMFLTTAIHAFIPFFWIFFAAFIVPKFVAKLTEAGIEMPAMTVAVINFSSFILRYWFVYIFILAILLIADGAFYLLLLRSWGKTTASLWSIVVMLVEGVFTVSFIIALWLPLMNIITSIK